MDRLTALFEELSLPEVARVLRHTALGAVAVGIVGLAVCLILGHAIIGLGIVVGLALGLVNIRVIIRSVNKVTEQHPDRPKRVLAVKSLYRLALTTLVVIGFLVASVDLGFGTLGGIGAFYVLLLASLIRTLLFSNAGRIVT